MARPGFTVKNLPNGVRYQGGPSDAEMQRRYDLVSKAMKAEGVDLIATSTCDPLQCQYVRYFVKVKRGVFSVLLFDADTNISFFGHGGEGSPAFPEKMFGLKKFETNYCIPVWHCNSKGDFLLADQIIKVIKAKGVKKLGFVSMNQFPAGVYAAITKACPTVELVDFTDTLDKIIEVKSAEELAFCVTAVEQHERWADAMPSLLYVGRTEREVGMDMYRLSCICGATEFLSNLSLAGDPFGTQAANLQYQNKIIEEGDSINCLMESPTQSGYYADFRRLFALGYAKQEVIDAMAISKEAQEYMATLCKPGAVANQIFVVMNEYFTKKGLPVETRMHGHGQGYGLVERPYFDRVDDMVIEENMWLSLHPQIKYKGVTFAISSNFIVKKSGAELVNRYPHEVTIV